MSPFCFFSPRLCPALPLCIKLKKKSIFFQTWPRHLIPSLRSSRDIFALHDGSGVNGSVVQANFLHDPSAPLDDSVHQQSVLRTRTRCLGDCVGIDALRKKLKCLCASVGNESSRVLVASETTTGSVAARAAHEQVSVGVFAVGSHDNPPAQISFFLTFFMDCT